MAQNHFQERRKDYRLPFLEKILFTDGNKSFTSFAANISRGGLFVKTLDPLPIDSTVLLTFILPNQPTSLCMKSRVAHVVFDRQRCEIDCGMGFQFMEVSDYQKSALNLYVLNSKMAYLELRKVLEPERPNLAEIQRHLKNLPHLSRDSLELRYQVNRVCTLFDPGLNPFDSKTEAA